MQSSEIFERISPKIKENLASIILGFLGLSFIGYSGISSISQKEPKADVVYEAADKKDQGEESEIDESIFVDVSGAVLRPGVYEFVKDSRVKDAISQAGGFRSDANNSWVLKNLNLASKLRDGEKIYVPFENEETAPEISGGNLININSSGISELDSLPGIGRVTSEKIIDSRPYSEIEDLLTKKVVSQSVFEKIKDKISVN